MKALRDNIILVFGWGVFTVGVTAIVQVFFQTALIGFIPLGIGFAYCFYLFKIIEKESKHLIYQLIGWCVFTILMLNLLFNSVTELQEISDVIIISFWQPIVFIVGSLPVVLLKR